jgi:hypothetical protein
LKKFLILFFLIFVNFLKAEIGWKEKEDFYILNNGIVELVISKKRPGEIANIKIKRFEKENLFQNYLSFSPKEKEYISTWKFPSRVNIEKRNTFLNYRMEQDWKFLELVEEIIMEENKPYFYLSYKFISKEKYPVKRVALVFTSFLKYKVFRSIYGDLKKIENTLNGKWYTYGYDLWKENRFAENKWFSFQDDNGEGVCFIFSEIGNWNTFTGKWKYIWGYDNPNGTFTIEFDNPVLYEREIEDEIVIMDMYIGFYKGEAEKFAREILKNLEKDKEKKILPVLKIDMPVEIDGELKEEIWGKGFFYKNFINTCDLKEPLDKTEICFLYDEKGIYAGFRCYEKIIDELRAKIFKRDESVWEDDDIEFFFYSDNSPYYYQIALNSKGAIYDAKVDIKEKKWDKKWNADIKVKTKIDKDSWQGEIFIPWKDLNIDIEKLKSGKLILKGDVGRDKKEKFENPRELSNIFYSPEKKWHEIKNYGIFKIIENSKMIPSIFIKNQQNITGFQEKKVTIQMNGGEEKFYKVFVEFFDEQNRMVFAGNRIIKGGKERIIEIPFEINNKGDIDSIVFGLMNEEEIIFSNILPVIAPKKQIHKAQLLKSEKFYDIFLVSPNVKIKPLDSFEIKKISPEIKIYAAKNEYEPFQIVINPKENVNIEGLNIKLNDLIGKKGKISKENINWRLAGYIDIKIPSAVKGAYPGKWPDPLFVVDRLKIEEKRNYPLWFTVYVPKDTIPGEYKGEIELFEKDKLIAKFTLSLKVWNFEIPDISNLTIIAHADFLGKFRQNMDFKKMLENFKKHRISSTGYIYQDDLMEEYFEKYKMKLAYYHLSLLGDGSIIGPGKTWEGKLINVENKEFCEYFKEKIKKKIDEVREKGYYDKFWLYLWDEPCWNKSEWVRKTLVGAAKLAKEVDPNLPIFITYPEGIPGEENEISKELIDIWCPPVHWGIGAKIDKNLINNFKSSGPNKKFFVYYNRIFLVDLPAISSRVVPLMLWKYGIDGLLIWSTNYYTYKKEVDPWNTDTWYYMKGDGILLYPNEKWDDVLDSIRWELIREGLDDYDYIFSLQTLLEKEKLNEKEKREGELLLKEVSDLIKDFWNYEMDYTKYENIRIKVGNFLEKFYD